MQVPNQNNLPVEKLGSIFQNTSATYKFYWFISILDLYVIKGKEQMIIWEIIAEMVANAWYPIHYFHISFGKSDSMDKQMREIRERTGISIDMDKQKIVDALLNHENPNMIKSLLNVFTKNVPFRFLRPWIDTSDDRITAERSESFENDCLYSLTKVEGNWIITMNSRWGEYLRKNYTVLKDYAYWNLTLFLQSRNPNVPNIPGKLIKPIERNSLSKQHRFWDIVLKEEQGMQCIYTNKLLMPKEYDLDHFIPWSFVIHDQIWNLLPADSSINSSKSNKLPDLNMYLAKLAKEQQKAVSIIYSKNPNEKLLEDYLDIIDNPNEMIEMDDEHLLDIFRKTFCPMVQIAQNMNFENWTYLPSSL